MTRNRTLAKAITFSPALTGITVSVMLGMIATTFVALIWAAQLVQSAQDFVGLAAAGSLLSLGLFYVLLGYWQHRTSLINHAALNRIFGPKLSPVLVCDIETGAILWHNGTARDALDLKTRTGLADILEDFSATPDKLAYTLLSRLIAFGVVTEEFLTAEGIIRLDLSMTGDGHALVLVRLPEPDQADHQGIAPLALPVLRIDPDDRVLGISNGMAALIRSSSSSTHSLFPEGVPTTDGIVNMLGAAGLPEPMRAQISNLGSGVREIVLRPLNETVRREDSILNDFELLPVALVQFDAQGRISIANLEARRLLGISSRETPMLKDILSGLGRPVSDWLNDARANRLASPTEILRAVRNDRATFLQVTLRSIRFAESVSLIAVLNDATELKSLEEKFTQSQKMQAIGQLAGGVAHDFNNLLTAITGHCDLLLLRCDRNDVEYPDLIQIMQNANRAAALVRQLLAFSRKQTLRMETLDLQDTLTDLTHLLNRLLREKVTLTLDLGTDLPSIRADKRQFEQILMNIVVNARDAMPMGGEVRIETSMIALSEGLSRDRASVPAGDYVTIKVRDEGIGMSADVVTKIFDPFFTTKRVGEGTGLGLSTVYGIVKQSGGFIFVDSEEGVGTEFTLYFAAVDPLSADQRPELVTDAPLVGQGDPETPRPGALILLVEDEAPVRSFAARALQLQGHSVLEAESGEDALVILSDPDIRPDLFVSDVNMPGIDGPCWVSKVRDQHPETPVIFMSGYVEDNSAEAQARIGNAVFLSKPFNLSEFSKLVALQLPK